MLSITQTYNEPLVIGDSVIFIEQKTDVAATVRIDSPKSNVVWRDDHVYQNLQDCGFYFVGRNTWRRNGVDYSAREAVRQCRERRK